MKPSAFDELSLLEVSMRLGLTAEEAIEEPIGRLRSEFVRVCKEAKAKKPVRLKRLKLTRDEVSLKGRLMKQFGGTS